MAHLPPPVPAPRDAAPPGLAVLGGAGLTLACVVAAGLLRFHKLGDWSFAFDEVPTLRETRSLFGELSVDPGSQLFRLPRIAPLGYWLAGVGHALFGEDEFGTRVIPACAGTALVGVTFYLGDKAFGRRTALIMAALVALSPVHVFQSQQNRFYSVAALFVGLTLLSGSLALRTRASKWFALAAAGSLAALLSHTTTFVLFPLLCVGAWWSAQAGLRPFSRRQLVLSAAAVLLLIIVLASRLPLLVGWNSSSTFGYSVGHAVLASVNMLGWPMSLLAGLGLALLFAERHPQRFYWLSALAAWGAMTVLAPLVITYHVWYAFSLSFVGFVLAAFAIDGVYARLRRTGRLVGLVFVGCALALNLPSLASHFVDGSRPDLRGAVRHVEEHWRTGDVAFAARAWAFEHYAPSLEVTRLPPGPPAEWMKSAGPDKKRIWIVLESNRAGLRATEQDWLFSETSHRLKLRRQRFDYFENAVDVFLYERPEAR